MTFAKAYKAAERLARVHGEAGVFQEYPGEYVALSWRAYQNDPTLSERQLAAWVEWDNVDGFLED